MKIMTLKIFLEYVSKTCNFQKIQNFKKSLNFEIQPHGRIQADLHFGPNISIVMLLYYIQYMKKRDVIHSESGRDIIQGDYVALKTH